VAVVPTVLEAMTTAVTKIFTNVLRKSKKFRRLISCTKQNASTTTSTHKIQFYFYYFESTTITKKSNEKQKSTGCIIQKWSLQKIFCNISRRERVSNWLTTSLHHHQNLVHSKEKTSNLTYPCHVISVFFATKRQFNSKCKDIARKSFIHRLFIRIFWSNVFWWCCILKLNCAKNR